MFRHAASVLNKYSKGKDGLTAHFRLKGRKFDKIAVEFGEHVHYLKLKSKGKEKLRSRWSSGIWLGHRDESGETLIGTDKGVVKCRTKKKGQRMRKDGTE